MPSHEITRVSKQLRERITTLLTRDELACYDRYQERLRLANEQHNSGPIEVLPAEQAVVSTIDADPEASGLHTQLMALLRIETLHQ